MCYSFSPNFKILIEYYLRYIKISLSWNISETCEYEEIPFLDYVTVYSKMKWFSRCNWSSQSGEFSSWKGKLSCLGHTFERGLRTYLRSEIGNCRHSLFSAAGFEGANHHEFRRCKEMNSVSNHGNLEKASKP